MDGLHHLFSTSIPLVDEVHKPIFIKRHIADFAHRGKYLVEQFFVGSANLNFHLNSSHEGGINQIAWIKIGRENNELPERKFYCLTCLHSQNIDGTFKRYNPAV